MCVRLFHWSPEDVYSLFNMGDHRWPNLPPPPNPDKFQQFFFAMVDATIMQMNAENDPESAKKNRPPRRQV
jgi:hypothetical protein